MSHSGFFDFREKLFASPEPPRANTEPAAADAALTVSQLTAKIDAALRDKLPANVVVRGEVSNFNHHAGSGHFYFTLKDKGSCVDCVMFRSDAGRVRFTPEDGIELLATGAVRVFAQRGRYQLYVTRLDPIGRGALELALRQLREKLEREGLFDAERKREIPAYPRRIALVTSRETAALQDILKVLRKFPFLQLLVHHVSVQGDGSAEQVASAITAIGGASERLGVDLILLARGGGSLEDLWSFNDERVARAIAACGVPVVTGIGHETDVSIADLVADYHAHTPTEAAAVIVARWTAAPDLLSVCAGRLIRGAAQRKALEKRRLDSLTRHECFRRPRDLVDVRRQWLDERQRSLASALVGRANLCRTSLQRLHMGFSRLNPKHAIALAQNRVVHGEQRMGRAVESLIARKIASISAAEANLRAVSPLATLARGYTITLRKKTGEIVRSAAELKTGETIVTRFVDGDAESTVRDGKQMKLFE